MPIWKTSHKTRYRWKRWDGRLAADEGTLGSAANSHLSNHCVLKSNMNPATGDEWKQLGEAKVFKMKLEAETGGGSSFS